MLIRNMVYVHTQGILTPIKPNTHLFDERFRYALKNNKNVWLPLCAYGFRCDCKVARKYLIVRDKHSPTKQFIDNPQKGMMQVVVGGRGAGGGWDAEFPTNWQAFQTDRAGDDCLSTNNRIESRPCVLCAGVFLNFFFIFPRIGGPSIIPVLADQNRRHSPAIPFIAPRMPGSPCWFVNLSLCPARVHHRRIGPGCCRIVYRPRIEIPALIPVIPAVRTERMAYRLRTFTSTRHPATEYGRRICARNNYNNAHPAPTRSIRRRARRYA